MQLITSNYRSGKISDQFPQKDLISKEETDSRINKISRQLAAITITPSVKEILEEELEIWLGPRPMEPRDPALNENFQREMLSWQNREAAVKQIRRCYNKKENTLNLNQLNLFVLPDCIRYLTHLKNLWLRDNCLTSIPDSLQQLEQLERLYLTFNDLDHLPDWLATLPKLQMIGIDSNRIETPPLSFAEKRDLSIKCRHACRRIYPWGKQGMDGVVNLKTARRICSDLTICNEHIHFEKMDVATSLKGGTCTAMAFSLLDQYNKLSSSEEGEHLHPTEIFKKLEPQFMKCSQDFRTLQAAYNTFQLDAPDNNHRKQIIGALLSYFSMEVMEEYDGFDFDENPEEHLEIIEEILNQTPEHSTLVIRAIQPEDNSKKEAYGHTMILFRTGETGDYFYESGGGVYELKKGQEALGLYQLLALQNQQWEVPSFRFYLVGNKLTTSSLKTEYDRQTEESDVPARKRQKT